MLTENGTIYSMGSNLLGQLGIGDSNLNRAYQPQLVESLSMWHAVKICTSKASSFALMENGDVFSWGSCLYGILGIGEVGEN